MPASAERDLELNRDGLEDAVPDSSSGTSKRLESPSLVRVALRAAGLLIVIPTLVIIYLFRGSMAGKELPLLFILALAILGFYVLWSIIRVIIDIQNGLRSISRGEAKVLYVKQGPSELREMTTIINSLNKLTIEFRENAAQLERFIQQFSTLAELAEITAKVPNINELLSLVLHKAMAATNARRGSTLLLQEEGGWLDVISAVGWAEEPSGPISLQDCIARSVIETGSPLLIDDINEAGAWARPRDAARYRSSSCLIMPLKTKAGTVGTVCLADKASMDAFTQHDQQFLTVMLGQIGYAVENARLLQHARDSAQNLKQMVQHQQMQIQDAQRQILEAEKLSALGQLAGGVAHDFNNLLQAILGYAHLAQEGLTAGDKLYSDIESIRNAASRAAALTRDLLAFGRRQVLKMVDLDVNQVVENLLKMLRRVLGEQIELEFVRGQAPGTVHADPLQLEQILMNLCINARDAMPQGGRIRIETRLLEVDEAYTLRHPLVPPGRYGLLTVADTGMGMDKATLAQIFEPFFTTKEVGKGTGLGLATVYGIVQQHGGMIEVMSELRRGTTFSLYLPTVDRPAPIPAEKREAPAAGGTETILVAEDEEIVRDLTQRILEKAGYTVLTARDGQEAVRVFQEQAEGIALVILDVVMPKMDGRTAGRSIRALRENVPLLFTSGYSADVINTGLAQVDRLEFIEKPMESRELLLRVREILDARTRPALAAAGLLPPNSSGAFSIGQCPTNREAASVDQESL